MQAKVKQPAAARQTRHGVKLILTVETPDGREITILGDPDDPALMALKRGQSVEVFKDLSGQFVLGRDLAPATRTTENLKFQRPSRQLKADMLDFMRWQAAFLQECRRELKSEDRETVATLFQNALKKFRV